MSTPYNGGGYEPYPEHPEGSHPENGAYPGYNPGNAGNAGTADNYGNYDAFDVNTAAQASGASALRFHGQQLTDNIPGDGVSPHPINDPASNGWFHVKGNGKVQVFEALTWAFKAMFSNAKLWIPLGIIYALLALIPQFIPALGFISPIVMLLVVPWFVSVALQETLAKVFTYNDTKAPAYGKTLGVSALLGFALTVVMGILMVVLAAGALSTIDPNSLPNPNAQDVSVEEMWSLVRPVLGALAISGVVSALLAPFFLMQTWYAADNNGSFGHAFSAGFKAGASNYLKLLGLFLIVMVLNTVGAALFGLGLIVTAPVTLLAMAYAYRQISGGPVPKEAVATA